MSYKSKFTGEQVDEYLSRVEEAGNLLEIKEGLSEKADRNGHYPEFTAGFADNLVGRGEAIPAEFSFRASGGKSIEDGTARIKTLKGNAVVWNQKAKLKKYNETEILADGTIKIISTPPGNWSTITEEMQGNINNTYALILSCKGGTYENSKNYGQIFDIVVIQYVRVIRNINTDLHLFHLSNLHNL